MRVIPAVDIPDGKSANLTQDQKEAFIPCE